MSGFWKEFEADVRLQVRRIVLTALPYPMFLMALATGGSVALLRTYPIPEIHAALQHDIWIFTGLAIVMIAIVVHIAPPKRLRWNWYRYSALIYDSLGAGCNLSSAIHQSIPVCPTRLQYSIREIERSLHHGLNVSEILRDHACPGKLCDAFHYGRSEEDLAQLLRMEIRRFMDQTRYRMDQLRRLAPALAMGCAGIGLFWFMFRIVMPVLVFLMQWEVM